ncbi:MAG: pirin family protein [Gammaproteobacteria bacterium]|nr:pirin family protein [Gammaproteobacteria bacterium]
MNLLQPNIRDLGEFSVRRVLPNAAQRMVGPWVFFDHMGPVEFPPGHGVNVRPHPHINLATVTYLFEGEILHRDSVGSCQPITAGAINLMVAGSGIVHSERETPEVHATTHRVHGLQLWLALPAAVEEMAPAFHHHAAASIPRAAIGQADVRVMMGAAYDMQSPVETFSDTLFLEAQLPAAATLTLPDVAELGVYVAAGELSVAGATVAEYAMATFSNAGGITVTATQPTRLAIVGGAPLGERHLFWNFVSSRRERIEQAKEDWRERRFPSIPGDDEEFIPLP